MPTNRFKTMVQHLAPQHALSRFAGWVANCQVTPIKNWIIDDFIRRYGVDMSSAVESNPHHYINFNHFFTRRLRPDARPIAVEENTIASPVDGTVSQAGSIKEGRIFQAKDYHFDLEELLGGSKKRADLFQGGCFATFYLAPKDYHRVHMPVTGRLCEMVHVPGQLFSVNPRTTNSVSNLFARNERVISIFETDHGYMSVILVGAMLVASISMVWAGEVSPPRIQEVREWQYSKDKVLARGDEVGYFQLGSTVLVLFSPGTAQWTDSLRENASVLMGQSIGTIL
jgi:phosphatidylserine decarboxylase